MRARRFLEPERVLLTRKDLVFSGIDFDVLSAVNDGDSLLRQQLALLITSVDSCC